MEQSNWERDAEQLDVYICDYLIRKKWIRTAESLIEEGKVSPKNVVGIDTPEGHLFDWWSIFWETHLARVNAKRSETASGNLEAQQIKTNEQQLQMQQLQLNREARLQRSVSNHPPHGLNPGIGGLTLKRSGIDQIQPGFGAHVQQPLLQSANQFQPLPHQQQLRQIPAQATDQILPGFGAHVQQPLLQSANQFQPLPHQQLQQILAQVQAQGNIGNSSYRDTDPLSLRAHVQQPLLQSANQFQLLPHQQQQQILAQVQAQGNIGNSSYQDTDPLSLRALVRRSSNVKDSQSMANDESIGCLMQPTSSTLLPYQQQQQILAQVQAPGNIGNSSYRDIDPLRIRPLVRGSSNVKDSQSNANDESIVPIVQSTSSTLRDDMEHFGDVGYLDEHATYASKGFSLNEACCIRKSNSKVVCCHFSSDGELLASAGHDKKVVLWKIKTLQTKSTLEEHSHIITDVRFRPNSTHLATSSFDKTVRLWEAENPSFSFQAYNGHTSHVLSLDFHPKKNNLLCSSDDNNEIRIWNTSKYSCIRVSKGGTAQVRFQPRIGHLLAAASGNAVTLYDVETDRELQKLQGHSEEVHSVCWDTNGNYLASVSHDTVKVWSVASRSCIHEMKSSGTGNMYYSCVFHPSYSNLLVIGQYQSFALWNMTGNKWMTIPAHECLIPALATSPVTGMIASASHDKSVKIWK